MSNKNINLKEEDNYRLGQILVKIHIITAEQLKKSLEIKEIKKNKLLGQILLEEGYCTEKELIKGLHKQREETSIGQILIRSTIITSEQVDEAIQEQQITGTLLGVILVNKGYCNSEQLLDALQVQQRDNRLGALLLRENYINESQLEEALMEQQKNNIMLGEILIRLEFITSDDLGDILILQSRLMNEFPDFRY